MDLLSDEEIQKCSYMSRNKAKLMVDTVKLDYESNKVIAFTVGKKPEHSVLYNKTKDNFTCTCRWYTFKACSCAHIIAVNLWLKKRI